MTLISYMRLCYIIICVVTLSIQKVTTPFLCRCAVQIDRWYTHTAFLSLYPFYVRSCWLISDERWDYTVILYSHFSMELLDRLRDYPSSSVIITTMAFPPVDVARLMDRWKVAYFGCLLYLFLYPDSKLTK